MVASAAASFNYRILLRQRLLEEEEEEKIFVAPYKFTPSKYSLMHLFQHTHIHSNASVQSNHIYTCVFGPGQQHLLL